MFKRVAIGIGVLCRAGRGSVAFGAIPGADGVIKGCYDNSGYVKVIDSAVSCNAGSTPISWNQKGPKGDGSVHRGVFDKAATYSVGEVVYDPATSYNVCGTVAKDRPAGSYVKIKAGTDKWQQGDPATSSIYSPCMVPDMWALLATRGEKGQKGDAGPNNLYWARLSADGKLLAKNAPVQYFGNWGPGRALAPSRDTKSAAPGPRARAARGSGRHTGAGRIAHALHEVVAHNVSLIVAQAQALGATVRPTAMHCSVLANCGRPRRGASDARKGR